MENEKLIQQFISGDISAFNRLVRKWQDHLFNFLLKYTGDVELSKDIMQQTFIKVYKKLSTLQDHTKFQSWLFRIAVNLCKNEFRRLKNIPLSNILGDDKDDSQVLPSEIHAFTANNVSSNKIITKALQTIPSEQRIIIIMKHYHGLKFREISEIVKEPINTVKSRLYYGLTALRKIIVEWGISKEDLGYEM